MSAVSLVGRTSITYTDAQVARRSGLSLRRLDALVKAGRARPSGEGGRWNDDDLDRLHRVASWMGAGMPIGAALDAADRERADR